MTIREDYLPGCGLKIFQDPAEFTFTTDAVSPALSSGHISPFTTLKLF